MRPFHENPNRIHTELTIINRVDPDQTAPVGVV